MEKRQYIVDWMDKKGIHEGWFQDNGIPSFIADKILEYCEEHNLSALASNPSMTTEQLKITDVSGLLLTDETLEAAANRYAESENSCYTNDYYGYLKGAKDVRAIFVPKLSEQ